MDRPSPFTLWLAQSPGARRESRALDAWRSLFGRLLRLADLSSLSRPEGRAKAVRFLFVAGVLGIAALGPAQSASPQTGGSQGGSSGTTQGEKPQAKAAEEKPTMTLTEEERKLIESLRAKRRQEEEERRSKMPSEGVSVRLADIGGFRGAQSNRIMGYGLVVGLAGTGDTRQTPFTAKLLANALSRWGTMVKPEDLQGKNIAAVSITAELPPFAAPGRKTDVTVSSIGDAKSLEGGFLLPSPLGPATDPAQVYLMASGAVSIGGFEASAGGSSQRKNHQTVGRVPDGGDIQRSVPTQVVFEGGKALFDLDEPDFTTAQRAANALTAALPGYSAVALDAVTIEVRIPEGTGIVDALSKIEAVEVKANLPATVVINERTGTIVVGGNVKLGPAIIAHGSLQVRVEADAAISQPLPFSQGQTVVVELPKVDVAESEAQVALTSGTATIDDLARILQTLRVSARDIISILQALADQGALKAKVRIQ